VDIIIVNPDLPGPDGADATAGKLYRVKFNLVTWKVLSFKQMPQSVQEMADELERDLPMGLRLFNVMELDEDIPDEATRDLVGMQRFFDEPARIPFFDGLAHSLKHFQTVAENVA
jgi:hypothetical protein